ncbi:MAG TPA: sulfatase-like hydrolase/transferase, partial [Bacteroidales bacterium]|nr:sulfatase-like hydrolase/transferase [Bacteroidales bacterium]
MKNLFFSIIKLFLFWIILFYIQQISFLLITPNNININLNQILKTLWYGIYLNISTASYLTILPLLFIILAYSKIKPNFFLSIANSIIYFEIIICIIVGIIDIGIFYAWNTKFNSKALSYIFYPSELFRGINSAPLTILLFSFIIILTLTIIIFNKYLKLKTYDTTIKYHKLFITTSIILFLLIIGMRGGIQARPINKGWAYHSINQKLNYSAINSMWNFAEVLVNYENKTNQYIFFEDNIARQIVKDLHNYPKDNVYILQSLKPNIVLIIMESVSAENLISLGGNENIMPGLDSISKQGILFTDFYANGFRTEQGLIALLSGFPAQPANFTVIRDFNRFEKLPNLARILLNNGYNNNYYYSGNLNYANTKSYLYIGGFNKIIGEEQQWKKKTQWGAYDEELFDFHIKNACNDAQPFFSIIMTSTNHEPFEANVTKIFTNKGEENSYKNTSYYTDKCII